MQNHKSLHGSLRSRGPLPALALVAALTVCLAPARAQKAPVPATPQPTGNCTHPDTASRPDCKQAIAFLATFQDALKSNSPQTVAALVHYPLLVANPQPHKIPTRAALVAGYPRIFTAEVRAAILGATPDDVWGNSHGFMIGRGVVWFDSFSPARGSGKETPSTFRLMTVNPVYP